MGFFITLLLFAALTIAYEFLRPKPEIENAEPARADGSALRVPQLEAYRVLPVAEAPARNAQRFSGGIQI